MNLLKMLNILCIVERYSLHISPAEHKFHGSAICIEIKCGDKVIHSHVDKDLESGIEWLIVSVLRKVRDNNG